MTADRKRSLSLAIQIAVGAMALESAGAQNQLVDLGELDSTRSGFVITGIDSADLSGRSVSGAGDVNGDGLADFIIGAYRGDPGANYSAGESYVVFGKADTSVVDLGNLGAGGFQINGLDVNTLSGESVSGAGDVNGDGLDDVIIGARAADPGGRIYAGQAYVVFGKADSAPVELGSLGAGGFHINGIDNNDRAGFSVSGAGDVNGDGLDDVIVGAYGADPGLRGYAGESYVVFGKADGNPVELGSLGAGGFQINGIDAQDFSGVSVSGAGDINGDGLDDVIVGASSADPGGASRAGESYVVFGKASTTTVELGTLGPGGFQINGIDVDDFSGRSVSGAGDVNGDGLDDLVIGAFGGDPGGKTDAGESYVVFGRTGTGTVSLGTLGSGGFRIDGIDAYDQAGRAVSGAGDVNGDGLDDLIIGAPYAAGGMPYAGRSYVVFGKPGSTPIDLDTLGAGGFQINGIGMNDKTGRSVSGAGDVNGDGLADLVIGAPGADVSGQVDAGESYLVFGRSFPADVPVPPPMNLAGGDRFGGAVASDGNLVVVGLPNADGASLDAGRVAVYRAGGRDLVVEQVLDVPAGYFATNFGGAVDLEGGRLLIGAPGTRPGAAKGPLTALQAAIFERASNGLWTMKVNLPPTNGNPDDRFGAAVALDGETVVVGAPGDAEGVDSGAAYVYQFANDTIMQMRKLKPDDQTSGGEFGAAVAAGNGRIAVGSPNSRIGAAVTGSVRLFEQVSENLMDLADRGATNGSQSSSGGGFGTAVALEAGLLAVGAPGENDDQGATYLVDPANMTELGRVVPGAGATGSRFGQAVGVNAGALVVGAPGLAGGGGVYRFSSATLQQTRLTTPAEGQQGLGSAVDVSASAVAIGAPDTDSQTGAALLQRLPTLIYRAGFE